MSASIADVGDRSKINIQMKYVSEDVDVDVDDKYAFVHPSIRDVLVMEPRDIPAHILDSKWVNADNNKSKMVNTDDFTIQWDVLETFIETDNSKANEQESSNTISLEQLVTLASQCDSAMFQDCKPLHSVLPSPIRGLLQMIPEECRVDQKHRVNEQGGAYVFIATLLALNMVENSIRHLIGKKNGRAPLLKDMIEIMAAREGDDVLPKAMGPVLRTLLLPTNGLNLRNLLWHGFLPTIPRKWFALLVMLALSLDKMAGSSSFETSSSSTDGQTHPETITTMRKHNDLVKVLDHGKETLASPNKLSSLEEKIIESNIIPRSHIELFKVSLTFVSKPVVFASVMGPFIEHLLRLMWCHENKQNKHIAEPGSYYVTLDGHGQKDKHEIAVMPFFCQRGDAALVRNQLVYRLGGSAMAFLMDMFTSPSGGPNIRATVAHGLFNKYLFEELVAIEGGKEGIQGHTNGLEDMTSALLSVLCILCEDCRYATSETYATGGYKGDITLSSYRPCFSYTASLLPEVDNMVHSMGLLYAFIRIGDHRKYSMNVSQSQIQIETGYKVAAMSQTLEIIVGMQERIYQNFGITESKFTDESFFQEGPNNSIASECNAAKRLLSEISEAASSSLRDLNGGIAAFRSEEIELSSRRRKQICRICSTAQLTLDFYSFAAYCALLYIERRQETAKSFHNTESQRKSIQFPTNDELFVAVKRSRMVLSTFSTAKSLDRALSALLQYTAGKAVTAVSKSSSDSSSQQPRGED